MPKNPFIKDKQIDDLKIPPHSLEAEQSVLGVLLLVGLLLCGLLLDNETWDHVAEKAVTEGFLVILTALFLQP
ncbi:MAG: hypothetical protein OCD00_07015 [Colwellia sp.]